MIRVVDSIILKETIKVGSTVFSTRISTYPSSILRIVVAIAIIEQTRFKIRVCATKPERVLSCLWTGCSQRLAEGIVVRAGDAEILMPSRPTMDATALEIAFAGLVK